MAGRRRRRPRKNFLDRFVEKENARKAKREKQAQQQVRREEQRIQRAKLTEAEERTANVHRRNEELERMLVDRPQGLRAHRPKLGQAYADGGAEALADLLRHALNSGDRPRLFPRSSQVIYLPDTREAQVAYELPAWNMTPPSKGYRHVKVRDTVEMMPLGARELKKAHHRVITRTMLRAFADTFDAAPPNLVGSVAVNGYLPGEDPATGKPTDLIVASAQVNRREFEDLVLTAPGLDPVECFKRFDSRLSTDPYAIKPIAPVVRFVDPALPGSAAVNGGFPTSGERLDLLAMSPREFEKVVHRLAVAQYGQAELTPASGDGGVDIIAVDENDFARVRYFIEAKQYRRRVDPKEIRSLHGAMARWDAHHAVLVTTAWFSEDSENDVADSRVSLINGKRLHYLLAKHCGIDAVIPHEKPPPGWSTNDTS